MRYSEVLRVFWNSRLKALKFSNFSAPPPPRSPSHGNPVHVPNETPVANSDGLVLQRSCFLEGVSTIVSPHRGGMDEAAA